MRVSEVIEHVLLARDEHGLNDNATVLVVEGSALTDDWEERRVLEIRPDEEARSIDLVTEALQLSRGYTLASFVDELRQLGPDHEDYEVRTLGDPVITGEEEWYSFNTGLIAIVPDPDENKLGLLQWFKGWEEVLGYEEG